MKRTFCTIIRDEKAEEVLGPMAWHFAKVRHWAFREIHIRNKELKDVKRDAISRFGITARQFNGIRFELDQEIAAWRGGLEYRQEDLKDRIHATAKHIARIEKRLEDPKISKRKKRQLRFARHQKKRHLAIQKDKLAKVEKDLKGPPRICFGGRKLLRRDEIWQWQVKRSSRINLVGSSCETAGNQSAQWDGQNLKIRLPNELGGTFVTLEGVAFRYGQEELQQALSAKVPLTWLLFRDEQGRWQARVTIEEAPAEVFYDRACGAIGVDLNVDHLAVVSVDRMGNPVAREAIPFPISGTPTGKAEAMIGEATKRLTDLAMERGCAIAVEKLDFAKKKAGLRAVGVRHASRLSGFAYARFYAMLSARCERLGIELKAVNPAYTSVIGKMKYAPGRAMSAHHAAALVIARRAMGFGELFVCMLHGTLDGPGRIRPRHVWSRWRGARRRRLREEASVSARTAASEIGSKRRRAQPQRLRASAAEGSSRYGKSSHGGRTISGRSSAGNAVAPARA